MKTPSFFRDLTGVWAPADPVLEPGLGSDVDTIPADGVTAATLHYATLTPGEHHWDVNGTLTTETPEQSGTLWWSELEVVATTPGPVVVIVGGETYTLTAT